MNTLLNDYELVSAIKSSTGIKRNTLLVSLYERYTPLVNKLYYSKAKKFIGYINDHDKADFMQNAYLRLLEAVEYFKPEKIYNEKSWKFVSLFFWTLTNKVKFEFDVDMSTDDTIESIDWDSQSIHSRYNFVAEKVFEADRESKEEKFYNSLTDMDKEILSHRGKGKSIKVVAKMMGAGYPKIQSRIRVIKKLASKAFEVNYDRLLSMRMG